MKEITKAVVSFPHRICKCGKKAEYYYRNKLSGFEGRFCKDCLDGLREGVDTEYWVKVGFAKRIIWEESK